MFAAVVAMVGPSFMASANPLMRTVVAECASDCVVLGSGLPVPVVAPTVPIVDVDPQQLQQYVYGDLSGPRCDNPGRLPGHADNDWSLQHCDTSVNGFNLNEVGIWYCPNLHCKFNGQWRGETEGQNQGYSVWYELDLDHAGAGGVRLTDYRWQCDFLYGNPTCKTPEKYDAAWTTLHGEGPDWNVEFQESMYWGVQVFHKDN